MNAACSCARTSFDTFSMSSNDVTPRAYSQLHNWPTRILSCLSGTPIEASAPLSPSRPRPASDGLGVSCCCGAGVSSMAVMGAIGPDSASI